MGWESDVLSGLGVPITDANISFLDAWARRENTAAAYNPLATTQPEPGATLFNSVGVRDYASYQDGVTATITTLKNGYYNKIVGALQAGDPFSFATDPEFQKELQTWSGGGYKQILMPSASDVMSQAIDAVTPTNAISKVFGIILPAQAKTWPWVIGGVGIFLVGILVVASNHSEQITNVIGKGAEAEAA